MAGLPAHVVDHRAFASRAEHEAEVLAILQDARPERYSPSAVLIVDGE